MWLFRNDVKECWGRERLKDLEQDAGGGIIRLGPVVYSRIMPLVA